MTRPLRIALLTHSTNPRGAVMHALDLAQALQAMGHEPVVHAPDPVGHGFPRATSFTTVPVPAASAAGSLATLVRQRTGEYMRHFAAPGRCDFDVFHAQDGISGNALAEMVALGRIPGFVRTVHHLEQFADPEVVAWQSRSVLDARDVLCVTSQGHSQLQEELGCPAAVVGNGVDPGRFTPRRDGRDDGLRRRFGLGSGPVFIMVGGIEARKNALGALLAFRRVTDRMPEAQLVIAGGASLLDHGTYRAAFMAELRASGLESGPGRQVVMTGPLPDADMAPLYRVASALVFVSLREGFGMAVLEAMACGTPVVLSRLAPFTEFVNEEAAAWVDPHNPEAIAAAMERACDLRHAAPLRTAGFVVASRHRWSDVAQRHLSVYRSHAALKEDPCHA